MQEHFLKKLVWIPIENWLLSIQVHTLYEPAKEKYVPDVKRHW